MNQPYGDEKWFVDHLFIRVDYHISCIKKYNIIHNLHLQCIISVQYWNDFYNKKKKPKERINGKRTRQGSNRMGG